MTRFGRSAVRVLDAPVWLSIPSISFKVRGRLVTHGFAFAAVGWQEPNPEALTLACFARLGLRSFWDVGANIGYYTWLVKSAAPNVEAILFEPFVPNLELIRATIQRAALTGVDVVAAAVSDRCGQGTLRTNPLAGATSSLEISETTFEERYWGMKPGWQNTPLVSIDDIRSKRGAVDFIKIDVEGHEAAALRGAVRTIATDQPIVFVECSHYPSHPCLALEQPGYRLVDADRLSLSCDPRSTNFFAFPQRFWPAVEPLIDAARCSTSKGRR
jgi:FkbM family methyltransferase